MSSDSHVQPAASPPVPLWRSFWDVKYPPRTTPHQPRSPRRFHVYIGPPRHYSKSEYPPLPMSITSPLSNACVPPPTHHPNPHCTHFHLSSLHGGIEKSCNAPRRISKKEAVATQKSCREDWEYRHFTRVAFLSITWSFVSILDALQVNGPWIFQDRRAASFKVVGLASSDRSG